MYREMSEETILVALKNFGLGDKEVEVYILLAKRGPLKGTEIAKLIKRSKGQAYRILKNLQKKGFAEITLEHPKRFIAISFEKTIEIIAKTKRYELSRIEDSTKDLLNDWKKISKTEVEPSLEKFTVIEGNKKIHQKIADLIEKTESNLSATLTLSDLVRAEQFGVFESAYEHPSRYKIKFRFLTELNKQNLKAIKLLKPKLKAGINVKARNPELGLALFPRMVIQDSEEILFFISQKKDVPTKSQEVCIHTNCGSLIQSFTSVFDELWQHSTDLQNKIVEIETGKPTLKTTVIADAEMAEEKYNQMLRTAEKEIILMTSAKDLNFLSKRMLSPKELLKRNVSVKIMAPITNENLPSAEKLSKYCAVKHVPINYWRTLIVDGRYLLQFRTNPSDLEKPESHMHFESAFYSHDMDYLKTMRTALNDIWKKTQTLSTIKPKSTLDPLGPAVIPLPERSLLKKGSGITLIDIKPPGTLTEKDVLNKIVNARVFPLKDPSKNISRLYASRGKAVIHPPDYFNLPDMIISATHAEKQSTFGGGDHLMVFVWQKTPKGYAYVPVTIVAEENFEGQAILEMMLAGTPAGQNVQMVKKNELQIRIHGKTLFAGWTVPIQLFPPHYILPPACLRIEGYGDVKTGGYTLMHASGFKSEVEGNYFAAFVTFIHPASKYSGPGTDGVFARDLIMTKYPPISRC
jgi:sugar-specific transcriptional regulator TrmB